MSSPSLDKSSPCFNSPDIFFKRYLYKTGNLEISPMKVNSYIQIHKYLDPIVKEESFAFYLCETQMALKICKTKNVKMYKSMLILYFQKMIFAFNE